MTGNLILNGDPSTANQAANKAYVDAVATGLNIQASCYAGSTANLTAAYVNGASGVGATLTNAGALAAFSIDGVSPPINSRILIKDQSSQLENGIYTLTTVGSGAVAWILTRATDYDTPSEIQPGDLVAVINGTSNSNTSWLETATVVSVGVSSVIFVQFTANPATFLKVANNLSDVQSVSTSRTNLGLGTGDSPVFAGISTNTSAASTTVLQAYDVDNTTYRTFGTLTANNTPTCAFSQPSGGTLSWDGGVIGGTTPAAGTFTTVNGWTPNTSVQVKITSDQASANGGATVSWDATNWNNPSSMWVIGTPTRLTAPYTGKYHLTVQIAWNATTSLGNTGIQYILNGDGGNPRTIHATTLGSNNQYWIFTASTDISLTATHYIEIVAFQNSGGDVDLQSDVRRLTVASLTMIST